MTTIYSALYKDPCHLDTFGTVKLVSHPEDLVEGDGILLLHGGEDISPCIYGQKPGDYTYAPETLSRRDSIECALVNTATYLHIPIVGICRGAQLLTALAGGTVVQHVTNHGHNHTIDTNEGETFNVTSAHHQMCNPRNVPHELLAWSSHKLSKFHFDGDGNDIKLTVEPEVMYYPELNALAFQPHPEWMDKDTPFVQYYLKLIKEKLLCHS